jgi:V/A-type H+-transporting ATPase subunit I
VIYRRVDPTPLLALTFPAFVGLMVGDAGYGLVLLALLVVFRGRMMRSPRLRMIWPIGLTMAISMIVFGVLFGEVFGETGRHALHLEPILFDRREAVLTMLLIAFTIGVAQVGLGLALGIWNATMVHHRREAVGRAALLAGLITVVVMVASSAGVLPAELVIIGVAALIGATVIATLAMGVAGPVEMLGVMAACSYARLMAVALAVMLRSAAPWPASCPASPSAARTILLHSLNLALGIFDASVQSLRLHYAEFFTVRRAEAPTPFTSVLETQGRQQDGGGRYG